MLQEEHAQLYSNLFRLLWKSTLPCYPSSSSTLSMSTHLLRQCRSHGQRQRQKQRQRQRQRGIAGGRVSRSTARKSSPPWSLTPESAALSTCKTIWRNLLMAALWRRCRWKSCKIILSFADKYWSSWSGWDQEHQTWNWPRPRSYHWQEFWQVGKRADATFKLLGWATDPFSQTVLDSASSWASQQSSLFSR